ncbi:adenylosuccinate synthase [Candidatus Haliotispira prima]|uniref:Adenylosuccinate synthetase n=1 Tax=Candidatus Haliotispira prima TaxID=3034016 RepID=A0ABY8MG67_9SPIO|nr:adenylosuccinate synthase [Candidatus Haliotispira prima]
MPISAVVGANWGDEGKGKFTDLLAQHADFVVRFQGGSNAGHTIINEYGKFSLHLLPSGVFSPNTHNVLGPCVAVCIESLKKELQELERCAVPRPTLIISERAQLLFSYHKLFDILEEERRAGADFGSTRSGIAPFYSDMHSKIGVQLHELSDEAALRRHFELILPQKNILLRELYRHPGLEIDELLAEARVAREFLSPFLCDTRVLLGKALQQGKQVLVEGQLGTLRDIYHGIYPYSTSSSPLATFAPVGLGLPAREMKNVLAVTKAYSSCVGQGPFVVELDGAEAEELRRRGGDSGEYGATTGRPRRVGWFDAVATRYGVEVQGATEVALTNIDVLGYLDEIPVCVGYRNRKSGEELRHFPAQTEQGQMEPILVRLPGWKQDVSGVREFSKLPKEARDYVAFLEEELGVSITRISNGPRREQVIQR